MQFLCIISRGISVQLLFSQNLSCSCVQLRTNLSEDTANKQWTIQTLLSARGKNGLDRSDACCGYSFAHYLSPVSPGEISYRIIISWSEHNHQMLEKSLPLLERFTVPSYQIHVQKLLIYGEQCVNHIISLLYILYQMLSQMCYSASVSL